MSGDNPRLKDIYFSDAFIRRLAADIAAIYPAAAADRLLQHIYVPGFLDLSLKAKMRHITQALHEVLPADFPRALGILRQIAPRYQDFDGMVFSDYVALYGHDHWDMSLAALREFTQHVSAEFAIRSFLRHDATRALATMRVWAGDSQAAVRRLASEGCRPRLPWGVSLPAFKRDPRPLLPILEQLKDDPDEAVRRSVANNLNDIAKDNPGWVLDLAEQWYGRSPRVDSVVKHGCRTLLKRGNARALSLFGFAAPEQVEINYLALRPARAAIGESVTLSYDLNIKADDAVSLRLEYAVLFVKAYGKTSRKVFHQRERHFAPGRHSITTKHSFRDLSTRRHYPGEHIFEVIVNGVVKAQGSVILLPAEAGSNA